MRLSGFGGQGVVLAGVLLGEAGAMDGRYVSGSNSYGAQARGSGCKAEIIISNEPIDFPHVIVADILVAMSQGAYTLHCSEMSNSGIILYDRGLVRAEEDRAIQQIGVPATDCALTRLKNKQVANIVLLGALIERTKIVSPKAMEKAIKIHVNERFQSLNFEAFRLGMELGSQGHG